MGERINAPKRRQGFGHVQHQLRIANRHIRRQGIVGEGILDPGLLVCDHRKRRHLRASARRGRNRHHHRLVPQRRQRIHPLTNVHEPHRQPLKLNLGVLIEQPGNLGRIHWRPTAQGNDHIGVKAAHLGQRPVDGAQGRIRFHIKEHIILDANFIQHLRYWCGHAQLIEGLIGDNERPFLGRQLAQGHGQTTIFEVDLGRNPEPEHVFPALGHGFDVQQVLGFDVFAD